MNSKLVLASLTLGLLALGALAQPEAAADHRSYEVDVHCTPDPANPGAMCTIGYSTPDVALAGLP